MKKFLLLIASVIGLASAQAREPIYFTAKLSSTNLVPPQIGASVGYGEFSLSGSTLNYAFTLPGGWPGGEIHGPAGPGTNAPAIFDLGVCEFCIISIPDHDSDQCYLAGSVLLSRPQIADLLAGRLYVNTVGLSPELRGQVLPTDTDGDGVADVLDRCPDTPTSSVVDADGCSISQLAPCGGPWRNHGEYVSAVERVASQFFREGLLTRAEMRALVQQAAQSDCGTDHRRDRHGSL